DRCGDAYNATDQQPLTDVSKLNSTIVMLLVAGFVGKCRSIPVVHVRRSSHHWWGNACGFTLKSKRSNVHLADVPLCCKRRRMLRMSNYA
ncbi:hypothetical protein TNCV_717351, partial [Trichonephila clavipes]